MNTIDTAIIGAGQAGLAVSWHLQALGHDHVVLDRGRIGERWRSERWDSLRTLTPNWMTRLPGAGYTGPDPDGYMAMPELIAHFEAYARSFASPVVERSLVMAVTRQGDGFEVLAGTSRWRAHNVVIATGWADRPNVPQLSHLLPAGVQQVTSAEYRRPDQIVGDRVLVVGASASGAQIASELAAAGRDVTIAVGRHRRLPRRYRGRDIMWWLDRLGILDRTPANESERRRLLGEPSLPIAAGRTVDLGTLAGQGISITGRLASVTDGRVWFAADLAITTSDSERRLRHVLDQIDRLAERTGDASPATEIPPIDVTPGPESVSVGVGGIDAVVWATGFRRAYPWLHVPILDEHGEIRHHRGMTPVPGLFVAGMRFQSGRRSTFIDGARLDAPPVAEAIDRRAAQRRAA